MLTRSALRAAIAARRSSLPLRIGTSLCEKYLNAVHNRNNWDMARNGEMLALAQALASQPGDVFDVGANAGQWARQALPRLAGRRLHCFEIMPDIFRHLANALAGQERITLNNFGLGAANGLIDFNYCAESSDRSSRYAIADGFRTSRAEVRISTGDAYCAASGVAAIAFLKIDVEGMEFEVLSGFAGMLREQRIGAVQFEYGPGYVGARRYLKDVVELLAAHGYAAFRLFPNGTEPLHYQADLDEDFRGRNFVAVRASA